MSRLFLVWSLLLGLALAGAEWYDRGRTAPETGLVTAMEDGTPPIAPKKR